MVSEPFGVSHGRTGGGADAPSGRKARRASWEIRFGVTIRIGLADETGGIEFDGDGGIREGDSLGTTVDGASVTDVGDDGRTDVVDDGLDADGTSRLGSGGKSSS